MDAVINPACWFSWHGPLPVHLAARVAIPEEFHPSDFVIWIEDQATGAIWPYWVGPEYLAALEACAPGEPAPEELAAHVRWALIQAGIIVGPLHMEERLQQWQDQAGTYADAYRRGYVAVPDLLHPFHLGALRRYYRYGTRQGNYELGDAQVSRRFARHNDSLARYFHQQLTPVISQIAGRALKPSYVYFVSYLSGAELEKHTDRPQCDYSITLCIDASPEPEAESPWPIALETSEGEVKIHQRIGDALLYRGCEVAHARDRLADGLTSTSLLLHYVEESFDQPLD
jgi:hypothetical protein